MSKNPYTKKSSRRYRGPSDSESFNELNESLYEDLVFLYNATNEIDANLDEAYSVFGKNLEGLSKEIEKLKLDLKNVQETGQAFSFGPNIKDDTSRFDGTAYEINSLDKIYFNSRFKSYTLPRVADSSISRLKYLNENGEIRVPPSLEMVVIPDGTSVESGAIVKTTLPYDAVLENPGQVWERNVLSSDPNGEAVMDLFFTLPQDLASVEYANVLSLIPYPMYNVDIVGIYYTTEVGPTLGTNSTVWTPLNVDSNHLNNPDAVGYIAPGAWAGDEIDNSGAKTFIFPSEKITAMRITLRQTEPYDVSSVSAPDEYIYTYGLSSLDVKFDKFQESGKIIYQIEPNTGDTFSSIDSVQPDVYNVPAGALEDVFSYRVIWETALDSGTYTLSPVPSSAKAWIEVTLNKDSFQNLPVLTNLKVTYS